MTRNIAWTHAGKRKDQETAVEEAWTESGHGERMHRFSRFYDQHGKWINGDEFWTAPLILVSLPIYRDGTVKVTGNATAAIACRPLLTPGTVPSEEEKLLASARQHLRSLPAGPTIRGHATRVATQIYPRVEGETGTRRRLRLYLDARTGTPLRRTVRASRAPHDTMITDYTLWRQLPAGGSDKHLAGTLPRRFRVQKLDVCADGVTATTPGGVTATTPVVSPPVTPTTPADTTLAP